MPEHSIELWSAGDRVRVRLRLPGSGESHPVLLWLGSDGSAEPPELELPGAVWDWCALVSFDLPLCGARASEKLSAPAFDPAHALHAVLFGDAVAQLERDLERLLKCLAGRQELQLERLGMVALGRGAFFAEQIPDFLERTTARRVARDPNPDPAWLETESKRLQKELG